MIWNPFKKSSWTQAGNAMNNVVNTAVNTVVDTTNKAVDAVVNAGNTVAKTSEDCVNQAAKALNKTADQVNAEVNNTINVINRTVLKPAEKATADSLIQAARASKIAEKEFNAGMNIAGTALQTAANETVQGLVAAGKYLEQYGCNIAIGGALTGAFSGALNNPVTATETNAMFAPLSTATIAAMAASAGSEIAVRAACSSAAAFMVDVVWNIPDVKNTVGAKNKDMLVAVIATLMQLTVTKSPYAMISPQTASITVAGIVSFVIASLVCDGKLPVV